MHVSNSGKRNKRRKDSCKSETFTTTDRVISLSATLCFRIQLLNCFLHVGPQNCSHFNTTSLVTEAGQLRLIKILNVFIMLPFPLQQAAYVLQTHRCPSQSHILHLLYTHPDLKIDSKNQKSSPMPCINKSKESPIYSKYPLWQYFMYFTLSTWLCLQVLLLIQLSFCTSCKE